MSIARQGLWRVHVTVEPVVEWEKIGIDIFRIGDHEAIALEKQLEGRTKLSLTVVSGSAEVHNRAELLMKSFLACLELKAQRGYRFSIGSMEPAKPMPTRNGWVLLAEHFFSIPVVREFEHLDLTLFRALSGSLEVLNMEKRNRILEALEFLFDALAAHTPQQRFLSMYGGLNYLIAGEVKAGKTTRREDQIAVCLAQKGILQIDEVQKWMRDFDHFDRVHYDALQGRHFKKYEVDKIAKFFEEFLIRYIQYLRAD